MNDEDFAFDFHQYLLGETVYHNNEPCAIVDITSNETGLFYKTSDDCEWHTRDDLRPRALIAGSQGVQDVFDGLLGLFSKEKRTVSVWDIIDLAYNRYGMILFPPSNQKI